MFQQVAKYNTHMTNILLRLFDLEIKNKRILEKRTNLFTTCKELWKRRKSSKQNCRWSIIRIMKHYHNCRKLNKRSTTWRNTIRIWRILELKGIHCMQLWCRQLLITGSLSQRKIFWVWNITNFREITRIWSRLP
jgi:hypothetical protein